jgi:type III pantothenate kinase
MMLLDVGNTTLKWAFHENGKLTGRGSFVHRDRQLAGLVERAWGEWPAPPGLAVANVAGRAAQEAITRWAGERWELEPMFVRTTAAAAGVSNGYARPEQLGVDRWAASVAAWDARKAAVLVIDCGSAITADLVDEDGRHRGGLIAPGVGMMRHCLSRDTANLDILPPDQAQPLNLFGHDTAAAIRSGTLCMATAAIDRIAEQARRRYGGGLCVLLTGGDAPVMQPLLGCRTMHDPDLVLKGVALLAEEQA